MFAFCKIKLEKHITILKNCEKLKNFLLSPKSTINFATFMSECFFSKYSVKLNFSLSKYENLTSRNIFQAVFLHRQLTTHISTYIHMYVHIHVCTVCVHSVKITEIYSQAFYLGKNFVKVTVLLNSRYIGICM